MEWISRKEFTLSGKYHCPSSRHPFKRWNVGSVFGYHLLVVEFLRRATSNSSSSPHKVRTVKYSRCSSLTKLDHFSPYSCRVYSIRPIDQPYGGVLKWWRTRPVRRRDRPTLLTKSQCWVWGIMPGTTPKGRSQPYLRENIWFADHILTPPVAFPDAPSLSG